ncbi:hypothetical protein Vadar_017614 [Vaccinium darrowii]|uniref:Uncharacterized protein n=1 Tax=Vaccinium darrowii TaxID=229202 RepID=A0ACB7X2B6_9ERIC|nr:hypothetical protein Vadar_017614 [Vaccinium darrowii]
MHSGGGGKFGENIAVGSGDFTRAAAVGLWVGEKPNYDYNSNSCLRGQCGHYTHVVCRNSVRLGCARVRCNNSPQDYLNAHNSARAAVGVGPLTWDANLEAFAQNYATQRTEDCTLMHSGGGGKYGKNIVVGSGDFTGVDAVGLWVGEKPNYDYNSNSCVRGECGHYTQVAWRNSVQLGCARV